MRRYSALGAIASTILVGCGGGGSGGGGGVGGSSTPTQPVVPTFSVSTTDVRVDRTVASNISPAATVNIILSNMPSGSSPYARVRPTSNGVLDAQFVERATGIDLGIFFKQPLMLAPGVYQDTIEVTMCLDSACASPLAGSPKVINTTYTVTRPTGSQAPRIMVPSASYSISALPLPDAPSKTLTIPLSFQNISSSPYVTATFTGGILAASKISGTNVSYDVVLRPPTDIGNGVHNESLTFRACLDPNCVNELDGSPLTVTVDYRVSNSIALANGHTLRMTVIDHNESVWDSHSNNFYFIVPASTLGDVDMIASLDPATGTLSSPVPVAPVAMGLDVSDDGQFLYVGTRGWMTTQPAVTRLTLPSMTPALTIPLGNASDGFALRPYVISVVPGAPHTIVVSASGFAVNARDSLAVYDDAVRRSVLLERIPPNTDPYLERMCWGPASGKLYGSRTNRFNSTSSNPDAIYEMTLTASGIQLDETISTSGFAAGWSPRLSCTPSRVYSPDGFVFNPIDNSVVRAFVDDPDLAQSVAVSAAKNKVFRAVRINQSDINRVYAAMRVYDLSSFASLGTLDLPSELAFVGVEQLHSWGTNGIAFQVLSSGANQRANAKYFITVTGPLFGP